MEICFSCFMEVEIKKPVGHLKTWNLPYCWVRNRGGLGPGTSQGVMPKQECWPTYRLQMFTIIF